MITAYVRSDECMTSVSMAAGDPIPKGTVWIDVLKPDEAERLSLGEALSVVLPTADDMHEIEASSRTYVSDGALVVTAPTITRAEGPLPALEPTSFVLVDGRLITLRLAESAPVSNFIQALMARPKRPSLAADILVGLVDAFLDRLADLLEILTRRIEVMSTEIFLPDKDIKNGRERRARNAALQSSLRAIGRDSRLLTKIRASLTGFDRILGFLNTQLTDLAPPQTAGLAHARMDTASLIQQADFQEQQNGFLLDATVGLITIEQTEIVRVLSIAAAIFLPPTLIASLYGMNFTNMPELNSPWGYPIVLLIMLISVAAPLWYFRRRGWV